MEVFRALQVLVLLIFIAFTQAKTEDSPKNATEEASKALDPTLVQPEDKTDAIRKKKSATTTLCVEIRPSGPYQRPFQICEPAESKPYAAPAAAPAQGYYPVPAYEEPKPATPKPAPAYEAPAKVYSAPAKPTSAPAYGSSKPYAAHSPSSYSSVSYRSDDGMADMPEEEEEHSDELLDHAARSAGQEYGLPMTYLQPALKHKAKKGHNGLVITCQPSLAGYAATIPSHGASYGAGPYGGNMGGYGGYRSAMSRSSYGRYERPSPPRGYGGYAPPPAPAYKVPPPPSYYKPSYNAPSYSASIYKPAPAYKPAPSYSVPAPAPSYSAPTPSYPVPAPSYRPAPAPTYPQPAPAYTHPSPASQPSYQPAPAPEPTYQPAPAPQPSYQPAPAPAYGPPPPSASAYAPAPKPHSPAPAPAYMSPPTYGPVPKPHGYPSPVGYREAEESKITQSTTHGVPSQEEKEKHTIETMTQMAEARDSMAMEGKVKMPNPGWGVNEGGDNKSATMAEEMRAAETMGREDNVNENKV
ncbi:extensin-like [Tribolium madens]|uniref:extensin-like n=1 Tax=Tribolium madens TaxID=41895 RepID=UPI001CF7315D|nr:extensin-like [Tribolium madens]